MLNGESESVAEVHLHQEFCRMVAILRKAQTACKSYFSIIFMTEESVYFQNTL